MARKFETSHDFYPFLTSFPSSRFRIFPGGTPGNSWRGSAARSSKSRPYFRPKKCHFHIRFRTWSLKCIPIFRLGCCDIMPSVTQIRTPTKYFLKSISTCYLSLSPASQWHKETSAEQPATNRRYFFAFFRRAKASTKRTKAPDRRNEERRVSGAPRSSRACSPLPEKREKITLVMQAFCQGVATRKTRHHSVTWTNSTQHLLPAMQ